MADLLRRYGLRTISRYINIKEVVHVQPLLGWSPRGHCRSCLGAGPHLCPVLSFVDAAFGGLSWRDCPDIYSCTRW